MYHRVVFPCVTVYAMCTVYAYNEQDKTVPDLKTNADDFWDDQHAFADDEYNPDASALGMAFTSAYLALFASCCFCCGCFCFCQWDP